MEPCHFYDGTPYAACLNEGEYEVTDLRTKETVLVCDEHNDVIIMQVWDGGVLS